MQKLMRSCTELKKPLMSCCRHMRCFGEVGVERLQDELRVRGRQVGRQSVAHGFKNCEEVKGMYQVLLTMGRAACHNLDSFGRI